MHLCEPFCSAHRLKMLCTPVENADLLGVMRYGCYANGFPFDSHLANFPFFSGLGVTFTGRLVLR